MVSVYVYGAVPPPATMPTLTVPLTVAPDAGDEKPALSGPGPLFWTVTWMVPAPVLLLASRTDAVGVVGPFGVGVVVGGMLIGPSEVWLGVAVAQGVPRVGGGAAGDDLRAVDGERVRIRRGAAAGRHADADRAVDERAVGGRGERGAQWRRPAILHGDGARGRGGGAGVVAHGVAERGGGVAVAAGVPR